MPVPGVVFVLLWSLGQSGRNSGREEVPFRGCTGEERVEEDSVVPVPGVVFVLLWSLGQSGGRSLQGSYLQGHC